MIIYNANIHTANKHGDIFEGGFVEFNGKGKITQVGYSQTRPNITDKDYDAKGGNLYPGFIDAHCHVGVWGNAEGFEGDDGNEITDPCTPHLRAIDMINPTDRCFTEAAEAGVTTVLCGPGSANPIAGTFLAMKTAGSKRIDNRVIKNPAAVKCSFGENPKTAYNERNESPITRMATAAIIREQLFKAKKYMSELDAFNENSIDNSQPDFDIKCDALLPLLRNEIKIHAHCHRADDIFSAIRIAKEFDVGLVLIHATDAELIADELKKLKYPCVIGPIICDRSKPELINHSISCCGTLEQNDIAFAICTDHPVVPIQYLTLSAGLAIRGGLSVEKALRAITSDAAEICGISDRVGSIELGKDADFVLFGKGCDFFDVTNIPVDVFVDGKMI